MKKIDSCNLNRIQIEELIDLWIFSQRDRAMLKRRLLDGISFEKLAEEFSLSVVHTKEIIYRAQNKLFKHF